MNLRTRCGVFPHPREEWEKGKCKGYMDEQLHARYLEQQAESRGKTPKQVRQEKAAERKTEPHHDGISNPGGARW